MMVVSVRASVGVVVIHGHQISHFADNGIVEAVRFAAKVAESSGAAVRLNTDAAVMLAAALPVEATR